MMNKEEIFEDAMHFYVTSSLDILISLLKLQLIIRLNSNRLPLLLQFRETIDSQIKSWQKRYDEISEQYILQCPNLIEEAIPTKENWSDKNYEYIRAFSWELYGLKRHMESLIEEFKMIRLHRGIKMEISQLDVITKFSAEFQALIIPVQKLWLLVEKTQKEF